MGGPSGKNRRGIKQKKKNKKKKKKKKKNNQNGEREDEKNIRISVGIRKIKKNQKGDENIKRIRGGKLRLDSRAWERKRDRNSTYSPAAAPQPTTNQNNKNTTTTKKTKQKTNHRNCLLRYSKCPQTDQAGDRGLHMGF